MGQVTDMAEVDTSSYPKPQPQPQGNPLDQITKFGQVADMLGNIEAGKAVQGAIGPDGEIDRNALAQSLKGSVAGSMKAIPTLNAYETLRNAGHVADQAGLDNFQKRMALVNHVFGQIASKDNPTINDVNSAAARLLDPGVNGPKYGITFPVVMEALRKFRGPDGRPLPAAQMKQMALDMQTMTATTSEQLEAHAPRYEAFDDGTTIKYRPVGTKVNPQGVAITKRIQTGTDVVDTDPNSPTYRQTIKVPAQAPAPDMQIDRRGVVSPAPPLDPGTNALSSTVAPAAPAPSFAERYAPALRGAPAAGLAPGVAAAATSTAENSAKLGNELVAAANQAPITEGILQNLDKTLGDFTSGPGADWKRVGKAFVNTVVPDSLKDKIGFDPKSIASQEEFNKQAYNLAQSQFQALGGTGTDAKLSSAMSTSPNELISSEGNRGIVRMLRGNNDALKVKAREYNAWKKTHGEDSYADFSDQFNENFNPRVFQFKYIPKAERNAWYQAMSPDDRRSFESAVKVAKAKKWIKKEDLQ